MINMNKKKNKRIVTGVIAGILVLTMVIPTVASAIARLDRVIEMSQMGQGNVPYNVAKRSVLGPIKRERRMGMGDGFGQTSASFDFGKRRIGDGVFLLRHGQPGGGCRDVRFPAGGK